MFISTDEKLFTNKLGLFNDVFENRKCSALPGNKRGGLAGNSDPLPDLEPKKQLRIS